MEKRQFRVFFICPKTKLVERVEKWEVVFPAPISPLEFKGVALEMLNGQILGVTYDSDITEKLVEAFLLAYDYRGELKRVLPSVMREWINSKLPILN